MRLLALLLLLANLLAWAAGQGLLGAPAGRRAEPQRVAAQVAPERLRLLTTAELDTARERSRQRDEPLAAIHFSTGPVCIELGDFFDPETIARARAATQTYGGRLGLREVQSTGWTLVALPSARSRTDGERLVAAARKQGVRNAWLIEENNSLPWTVALGAFRDGAAAAKHLREIEQLGIKGARALPLTNSVPALRLRMESADASLSAQLAALSRELPGSRLALCEK